VSTAETPELAKFSFEDRGQIITEADLAADPSHSWEWKLREAQRLHDLWDGFRPGLRPVEDDSPRGFHWED
jgi:hypothetical protein